MKKNASNLGEKYFSSCGYFRSLNNLNNYIQSRVIEGFPLLCKILILNIPLESF